MKTTPIHAGPGWKWVRQSIWVRWRSNGYRLHLSLSKSNNPGHGWKEMCAFTLTCHRIAWRPLRWNLKQKHSTKLQKGDEKDGNASIWDESPSGIAAVGFGLAGLALAGLIIFRRR